MWLCYEVSKYGRKERNEHNLFFFLLLAIPARNPFVDRDSEALALPTVQVQVHMASEGRAGHRVVPCDLKYVSGWLSPSCVHMCGGKDKKGSLIPVICAVNNGP